MFDRMSCYLPSMAAVIVLPLAVTLSLPQQTTSKLTNILSVAPQPLRFGVKVATVTRPLDLKALSTSDFGDGEQIR